jgi:hypothetical protein
MVQSGAQATLSGAFFEANSGTALAVLDPGSELVVSDTVLAGGAANSKGLQVQSSGRATLTNVTVRDLAFRGVEVAGGVLIASGLRIERATGVGLLVGSEGAAVEAQDLVVIDTQTLSDGTGGGGIELIQGGVLNATAVVVSDNHGVGMLVGSDAVAYLEGLEITGTHPEPGGLFGRGLSVQDDGMVTVRDGWIAGNREAGVFVANGASAELFTVFVEATGRSGYYAAGAGVHVQQNASVVALDLTVSGTEGPGLYIDRAFMKCEDCSIHANGFAGAVVRSGTLQIVSGEISGNVPDDGLGGGVGVFAESAVGPTELVVSGTTITDHAYGAVYLDGPGSYVLDSADLTGGAGWELVAGRPLHGDAVFATGGITPWDTDSGLLIVNSTLRDSQGAGVFLDGASAMLEGVSWTGNAMDVVQQSCGPDVSEVAGAGDSLATDICPEFNQLVVPLSIEMILQDSEAAAF